MIVRHADHWAVEHEGRTYHVTAEGRVERRRDGEWCAADEHEARDVRAQVNAAAPGSLRGDARPGRRR